MNPISLVFALFGFFLRDILHPFPFFFGEGFFTCHRDLIEHRVHETVVVEQGISGFDIENFSIFIDLIIDPF